MSNDGKIASPKAMHPCPVPLSFIPNPPTPWLLGFVHHSRSFPGIVLKQIRRENFLRGEAA